MKKKALKVSLGLAAIGSPILVSTLVSCSMIQSQWVNKRYVQLGDSITWYDGRWLPGTGRVRGYAYHLSKLGFKEITKAAACGACIVDHKDTSTPDISEIVKTIDFSQYDLVTIAGGVNDFITTPSEMDEFIRDYQLIIDTIKKSNPNIIIAILTPTTCQDASKPNSLGYTLSDYVYVIKQMALVNQLPILDLFSDSGITENNINQYTVDGLHLNNEGYELASKKVVPFIDNLKK